MEEGVFPHSRAFENPGEMEEERRLAYVGITRARKRLYLSYAMSRMMWGQEVGGVGSRFLKEIPSDLLSWIRGEENLRSVPVSRGGQGSAPAISDLLKRRSPEEAASEFDLVPGDRVNHDQFGMGKVVSIAGTGANAQVTVDFGGKVGQKRLLLRYSPVTKL
jgi:DNA helicase-2/ATP-dependent DNA helicase PcrA